jgi:hypothetical protein
MKIDDADLDPFQIKSSIQQAGPVKATEMTISQGETDLVILAGHSGETALEVLTGVMIQPTLMIKNEGGTAVAGFGRAFGEDYVSLYGNVTVNGSPVLTNASADLTLEHLGFQTSEGNILPYEITPSAILHPDSGDLLQQKLALTIGGVPLMNFSHLAAVLKNEASLSANLALAGDLTINTGGSLSVGGVPITSWDQISPSVPQNPSFESVRINGFSITGYGAGGLMILNGVIPVLTIDGNSQTNQGDFYFGGNIHADNFP